MQYPTYNSPIYLGEKVAINVGRGELIQGVITECNDSNATVKIADDSTMNVSVKQIYLLKPFTPINNAEETDLLVAATYGKWESNQQREDWLNLHERQLNKREMQLAEREETILQNETLIDTLRQRIETVTGQRDLAFRRLKKLEGVTE